MEVINQIFAFIGKLFEWWFMVMPWEQAIFVRAGSKVKVLNSGIYLKIPFFDKIFIQTIRTRMIDLSVQTITTKDGKTITLKSMVGYCIADIFKVYNTISHPEINLAGMVTGNIAEYMREHNSDEITPKQIEEYVVSKIEGESFGLKEITMKITSWADVKTFRLIQDSSGVWETLNMESLN